ncbi:DUF4386 domain-containing protein [Sorangium sp. So ce1389]|uniref:DUF4386 domain-containing protein n=1 Tax=Sorangium sp. So ce1389 TaxID=3133336 RepID=UPI003F614E7C
MESSADRAASLALEKNRGKAVLMGSRKTYSRVIGALFLSAFVFYGAGSALVTSILSAPDALLTISAHQTTLALGAFLMLLNSVVVVGLGVLFFPIVENHGRRTALAYLASRILEAVLLAVGVLCVLFILPLAQHAVEAGAASAGWARGLGSLVLQWNTMAFQLAMMSLGLGSVFLFSLLFRTRLIPRFLSVWGFIGYAVFLAGAIAEIFMVHIGVLLAIPGGLFELVLGFWLLARGFRPEAYGQD